MSSKQYQLIIFDWDGTLMDSIGRIVSSMKTAAAQAGLALPEDEAAKGIIGMSLLTAIETLFPQANSQTKLAVANGYSEAYLGSDLTPAPMFEGTLELLNQLKTMGYKLAVATGKSRRGLDKVLQETGLSGFFDSTATADEHESKPDPSMIHSLLTELEACPTRTMMVGDSRMDIEMAHAAGVASVAVGCGAQTLEQLSHFAPTHQLTHTCELLTLLNAR